MAALKIVVLICLVASGNLVSSLSTVPTPPPEVPPETGPPKDYHNCRINAFAKFSWIVAVYSQRTHTIIGHGSMITYNALISTCRQYHTMSSYFARAQFLWNMSRPLDPCAQDKQVKEVIKHPKCADSSTATFFDYAVLKLVKPFDITGHTYPTFTMLNNAEELLLRIKHINNFPNTIGCILPSFLEQGDRIPVFDWNTLVEAIPFRTQCIKLLCEKNPPDPTYTATCRTNFGERANGTQLCVTYKNKTRNFPLGDGNQYWIAGTPLVCNASIYGIAAQPHLKTENPKLKSEIHYVVTILRVWDWLIQQISENSAPWVRRIQLDEVMMKPGELPEPNRPPIQRSETIPSPEVRSNANFLMASILSVISALINYCFNQLM